MWAKLEELAEAPVPARPHEAAGSSWRAGCPRATKEIGRDVHQDARRAGCARSTTSSTMRGSKQGSAGGSGRSIATPGCRRPGLRAMSHGSCEEATASVAGKETAEAGGEMPTIERLLRWLEIPINLLLWIALIAGFLMMLHVGADVTGAPCSTARCTAPPRSSRAGTWWRSAICPGRGSRATTTTSWRACSSRSGPAGSASGSMSSSRSVTLRLLRRVRVADLGAGDAADAASARCGRRPAASSRCGRAAGCCRSLPALMCVYLVLRVMRDVGRGYRPDASRRDPGGRT